MLSRRSRVARHLRRLRRARRTGQGPLHTIRGLDGLRGIAILLVMAFHEVVELAPGGAIGVDLFFALSAFLITTILLAELDAVGSTDFMAFYWRRACRLGPALVIFLVLVAPLCAFLAGQGDTILGSSLITLVYLSDFGSAQVGGLFLGEVYRHTWSLSVEEQFYLVWPALLLLLYRGRRLSWAVGLLLLGTGLALITLSDRWLGVTPTYFLPTGHLAALAAGVLASIWVRKPPPSLRWPMSTPAAVTGWVAIGGWVVVRRLEDLPMLAMLGVRTILSLAFVVTVVHVVVRPTSWVSRVMGWSPLVWLGRRSYGLYLYGTAMHVLTVGALPLRRTWAIPVAVALGVAVSAVSYQWVEQPLRRRGRSWFAQRRLTRAAHA